MLDNAARRLQPGRSHTHDKLVTRSTLIAIHQVDVGHHPVTLGLVCNGMDIGLATQIIIIIIISRNI